MDPFAASGFSIPSLDAAARYNASVQANHFQTSAMTLLQPAPLVPPGAALSSPSLHHSLGSLLDEPVILSRAAIASYATMTAAMERELLQYRAEKQLWLRERESLQRQIEALKKPVANTHNVSHAPVADDWVSGVLHSLGGPKEAHSDRGGLTHPTDTMAPRLKTDIKRKRSATSDDDDSSTVNDMEYISDEMSDDYSSPPKRAKYLRSSAVPRLEIGMVKQESLEAMVGEASLNGSATESNETLAAHEQTSLEGSPRSAGSSQPATPVLTHLMGSRRGHLPERAIRHLKVWFFAHKTHPYPSEDEKHTMMEFTGLSRGQINNWFTNARRRLLPRHER